MTARVSGLALLLSKVEPVIRARKMGRYLDIAAREWNLFFKENIFTSIERKYR